MPPFFFLFLFFLSSWSWCLDLLFISEDYISNLSTKRKVQPATWNKFIQMDTISVAGCWFSTHATHIICGNILWSILHMPRYAINRTRHLKRMKTSQQKIIASSQKKVRRICLSKGHLTCLRLSITHLVQCHLEDGGFTAHC